MAHHYTLSEFFRDRFNREVPILVIAGQVEGDSPFKTWIALANGGADCSAGFSVTNGYEDYATQAWLKCALHHIKTSEAGTRFPSPTEILWIEYNPEGTVFEPSGLMGTGQTWDRVTLQWASDPHLGWFAKSPNWIHCSREEIEKLTGTTADKWE